MHPLLTEKTIQRGKEQIKNEQKNITTLATIDSK
jgi:hypothetical protein